MTLICLPHFILSFYEYFTRFAWYYNPSLPVSSVNFEVFEVSRRVSRVIYVVLTRFDRYYIRSIVIISEFLKLLED